MKQHKMKKLTKFISAVLAGAIVFSATPFHYAAAADTLPVVTINQEVTNQAQKQYLVDPNGHFIQHASADQVKLPFSPEQYYGRSLLSDEGKKAWDYVVNELLGFNPANNYDHLTTRSDGHGKFTIHLKEAGITAPEADIKNFSKYLNASDARMFHIRNWIQEYTKDAAGNVETVTFYIPSIYMEVNAYQNTLMGMEAYVSQVLNVVDTRMTEAQKVRALYHEYISTMTYSKGKESGNAVGALTNQEAICGGFSFGFLYILQRAGLEAIYLTGDTHAGYHAWNYVKIDHTWYFLDTTWRNDTWLLRGQSVLSSHQPRTTQHFSPLPTLSETDYNLTAAVFVARKYTEPIDDETYQMAVKAVKEIFDKYATKISDIKDIYRFEGDTVHHVGNEIETVIYREIRKAIKEHFTGSLPIEILNYE